MTVDRRNETLAYGVRVTAVDKDPDVFPYLRLYAGVNGALIIC